MPPGVKNATKFDENFPEKKFQKLHPPEILWKRNEEKKNIKKS